MLHYFPLRFHFPLPLNCFLLFLVFVVVYLYTYEKFLKMFCFVLNDGICARIFVRCLYFYHVLHICLLSFKRMENSIPHKSGGLFGVHADCISCVHCEKCSKQLYILVYWLCKLTRIPHANTR